MPKKGKTKKDEIKKGEMSVKEAGRLGGVKGGKKGGLTTRERHGIDFYQTIGRKGGQKVKLLIEAGKRELGIK
jgi:general stress protein YciG